MSPRDPHGEDRWSARAQRHGGAPARLLRTWTGAKSGLRRAGLRKPDLRALARKTADRAGYHLVPKHYGVPIPDLSGLPDEVWDEKGPCRGIELDPSEHLRFLETRLAPYFPEFDPPLYPGADSAQLSIYNGWYQTVESEVLYGFVRHLEPKRIVELGSGFTTQIMGAACERNRAEGHPADYLVHDLYPRRAVLDAATGITEFRQVAAEDLPLSTFASLGAGDVLFVDTSHAVRLGGDVVSIVLDVLPTLAPGVVVHFHDIFLPWDYPRDWVERHHRYWNEQYLLQAFLTLNPHFELLFAAHAVIREHPERLRELVPSFAELEEAQRRAWAGKRNPAPSIQASAFWMQRRPA